MVDNVIELEEISCCPNCKARVFEVVETRTSGGPFCRCVECGWTYIQQTSKSTPRDEGACRPGEYPDE